MIFMYKCLNTFVRSCSCTSFKPIIIWFSFSACTILNFIWTSSVLTRSSLSLHVNVKQDVEIKHPVGAHVFVGLQLHVATLLEDH